MKRPIRCDVLSLCLAVIALPAKAEIVKCLDAAGNVTYSEKTQSKGACAPMTATINVVPTIKQLPLPTPPQAPRVEQGGREALQKQIAAQEAALAEAKKALAEQENIRLGGERNYQRVLDRLKPYQDKVAEIEKNLAQLHEALAKAQ